MSVKPFSIALEPELVAEVDAKIGHASRSAYVRGAIRLRLVIENRVANDKPVTDAWVREWLAVIESPVIA